MRVLVLICYIGIISAFNAVKASHAAGGYWHYECLGNDDYLVEFFFLRDCSGVYPDLVSFKKWNDCGTQDCPGLNTPTQMELVEDVDFGCGNECSPGGTVQESAPSYQLFRYWAIVNLPTECDMWTIEISISQRNDVMYGTAFGTETYYSWCKINNTNGICNNSADINGIPVALGCVNGNGASLYNVTDPDGHTINCYFDEPKVGICSGWTDLDYNTGTSEFMPVPSTGNFNLNVTNSEFTFNPIMAGDNYFCVVVEEFDANGVKVGENRIDGIVWATANCVSPPISFEPWNNSSNHNVSTGVVGEDACESFNIIPSEGIGMIQDVQVQLGQFLSLDGVAYNPDGSATVTICANFPDTMNCEPMSSTIDVDAKIVGGSGCLASVTETSASGSYTFTREAGTFCSQHLFFTNRNSSSGIGMPVFAKAKEEIWVGDNMPAYAPTYILADEGEVEHDGNIHLVAGNQIVIPSCDTGTGCVTINGNVTLEIRPQNCSPDCDLTPLDITCRREFNCFGEKLIVDVNSGTPPYTYTWVIDGQTYFTSTNEIEIHDIISNFSGHQITYHVNVYDATSQEAICGGLLWGTKRFYEDIHNNVIYFDYPDNALWDDGYYYAGQPGVDYTTPFFIADSVNTTPVWYGATRIYFRTWSSGGTGETIYWTDGSLEGQNDFSFDNAGLYWNGHWNNNPNEPCAGNSGTQIFNYLLKAENCVSKEIPDANTLYPHHEELSAIALLDCTDFSWYPDPAQIQAGGVSSESVEIRGFLNNTIENQDAIREFEGIEQLFCYPNPSSSYIEIHGSFSTIQDLVILDEAGRTVIEMSDVLKGEKIDIKSLANGMYIIEIRSDEILLNRLQFIKE